MLKWWEIAEDAIPIRSREDEQEEFFLYFCRVRRLDHFAMLDKLTLLDRRVAYLRNLLKAL